MNPREFEGKESPALSVLMKFEERRGTESELQDALYYLALPADVIRRLKDTEE
jgi:hypothetical protein